MQKTWIFLLTMFLFGCAKSPLVLTKERRFGDSMFSGFSSWIIPYSRLSADQDSLYFGTRGGNVFCLNARNGKKRWKTHLSADVDSEPVAFAEKVFVGSVEGRFYALSKENGQEIWHQDVTGEVIGRPLAVDEDKILFATNLGLLYALNIQTGQRLWQYRKSLSDRMTVHHFPSMAVRGKQVFAGFPDGSVVALNKNNGSKIWDRYLPRQGRLWDVTAFVKSKKSRLLAGQFGGDLHVMNDSGKTLWTYTRGGSSAEPFLYKDLVFLASGTNGLVSLHMNSGEKAWQTSFKDASRWTGFAKYKQYLLATTAEGIMYVLSDQDGALIWRYDFGSPVQGSPVVVKDRVWVLTRKGRLFQLRLRG